MRRKNDKLAEEKSPQTTQPKANIPMGLSPEDTTYLEKLSSVAKHLYTIDSKDYASIPDFGIFQLSITEAADLLATDMWFQGMYPEILEPADWDGSGDDPTLKESLKKQAEAMLNRLVSAIDSGRLDTSYKQRDLNEQLIPSNTYLSYEKLYDWLEERNYKPGESIDEWFNAELIVSEKISGEVGYLRALNKEAIRHIDSHNSALLAKMGGLESASASDLLDACKALVDENNRLRDLLPNKNSGGEPKVDRPLTTRRRRTLVTVIAGLASQCRLDPKARGTAKRIADITNQIGAPVSEETVFDILSEIPEALETRSK
jgi:hypothetical protein